MQDVKKILRNFEQALPKSSWFEDGWEIFNRGPYLQLYKEEWYNKKQGGIHFETYIEDRKIKNKAFTICMHVEEDYPQQQAFLKEFLRLEAERIRSWKGYSVVGKGYSVCIRTLPLSFKNLEQRLLEEFNRLRLLEPSIEKTLHKLKG